MSKAEELAQWLEARGEENTDAFATHLRAALATKQAEVLAKAIGVLLLIALALGF